LVLFAGLGFALTVSEPLESTVVWTVGDIALFAP
jgi:hypothetical protein